MKTIKLVDPNLKSQICESILRGLPEWFGIESAVIDYIKDVRSIVNHARRALGHIDLLPK